MCAISAELICDQYRFYLLRDDLYVGAVSAAIGALWTAIVAEAAPDGRL
jgi:hypothetical protein